jgi:cell division protein ZapA
MENRVDVVVNGEIFTIKSHESVDYLQRLAHYTSKRMDEISSKHAAVMINERIRTLLIALNIADDYFKVEPELTRLTAEREHFVKEMSRIQEENIMLSEKVHSLQRELTHARAELDELDAGDPNKIISLPVDGRKVSAR